MTYEERLVSNWGMFKRNVTLSVVVDPLIENGIITPDQWMDIKHRQIGEPEKMEEFLYILVKQKSVAFEVFEDVLKQTGFQHVAECLRGISRSKSYDQTKTDFKNSIINIQTTEEKNDNNTKETLQNFNSSDQTAADTVRQKDLDQMKQEIKDELRNLQTERKQDRDQVLVLKREHKQLKHDFEKLQSQNCELTERLENLLTVVDGLNNKLEEKEETYVELKQINNGLKEDLRIQSLDHSKANNLNEKETEELEKKLQKKTDEYELLQKRIETLKSDHEERLNRLRTINKEKVRLEGEHKKVLADKKDAEAKFQTLDQQAREVQIKHERAVANLQNDIERKLMHIEELEQDKSMLEQRLGLTEQENEMLKLENKTLEEKLHKSEEEKETLNKQLQNLDLQHCTLPPFSSVVRNQTYTSQARPNFKPRLRRGNQGK